MFESAACSDEATPVDNVVTSRFSRTGGRRASLRVRLILLVSLALLPAFALILWSAYKDTEAHLQAAEARAERLAGRAAVEFGQLVEFTREIMGSLSGSPEIRNISYSPLCNKHLAEVRERHPAYGLIGIIARDGNTVCADTATATGINLSDQDYFKDVVRSREFVVSHSPLEPSSAKNFMVLAAPMFAGEAEVAAVLFLSIDLAWVRSRMAKLILAPDSSLMLIDAIGTVMATYPDAQAVIGQKVSGAEFFLTQNPADQAAGVHALGLDGVSRVAVSVALPHIPPGSAFIRAGVPTAEIVAAQKGAITRNIVSLMAVAVLAFTAAWALAGVLVVAPIKRIISAAVSLGRGDMSARTGLDHGTDELGQLGLHFDEMAARLQRKSRALRTLKASSQNLLRSRDEGVLLEEMCRTAVREGGYQMAWIGLASEGGRKGLVSAARVGPQGDVDLRTVIRGDKGKEGPAERAVRLGTTQVVRNLLYGPTPDTDPGRRPNFAECALPLKNHGKTIGAFKLYADTDAFDSTELELLEELAEDIAFGIQTLRDRRRHEQADEKIRLMAYQDSLTGLPNRASIELTCDEALVLAKASHGQLAIFTVSLAHFTRIQNAIGFAEADLLIIEIARRLRAAAEPTWSVARLAGELFAILIPNAGAAEALRAAQELGAEFERPFAVADIDVAVGANIGISVYPEHGTNPGMLLRRADVACASARTNGVVVELYCTASERESPERLQLMVDLRRAIDDDQLTVAYQGKVCTRSGRVTGAEALVRWKHPVKGNIPPATFIPDAEKTGLIKQLTHWVLDAVLKQISAWSLQGAAIPVSVNLSGRNFRDPDLLEELHRQLTYWKVEPSLLQIEITESMLMDDVPAAQRALEGMRAMGIVILIDDFGTGYSSLRYLASLPVDVIKIDRSFVIEMAYRPKMHALVAAMIDMGHKLGMKLIAEGVDDERQAVILRELGCDEIQGFLYCVPLEADRFSEWVVRHSGIRLCSDIASPALHGEDWEPRGLAGCPIDLLA